MTGTSGARGGGKFERTLIKDPRGPDPLPVMVTKIPGSSRPRAQSQPARRGAPPAPYIQPGPWKSTLTEKDVIGVWLGFGVGAPKQYFIFRKVGSKLRGMVCGTCDNPYTMAALDDFEIQGDTLKFNFLHEDWGDGELPTFYKHATCHVGGMNCGARRPRTISRRLHRAPRDPALSPDSRSPGRFRSRPRLEMDGRNGPRRTRRYRIRLPGFAGFPGQARKSMRCKATTLEMWRCAGYDVVARRKRWPARTTRDCGSMCCIC